jgi:hypothetical protein
VSCEYGGTCGGRDKDNTDTGFWNIADPGICRKRRKSRGNRERGEWN